MLELASVFSLLYVALCAHVAHIWPQGVLHPDLPLYPHTFPRDYSKELEVKVTVTVKNCKLSLTPFAPKKHSDKPMLPRVSN